MVAATPSTSSTRRDRWVSPSWFMGRRPPSPVVPGRPVARAVRWSRRPGPASATPAATPSTSIRATELGSHLVGRHRLEAEALAVEAQPSARGRRRRSRDARTTVSWSSLLGRARDGTIGPRSCHSRWTASSDRRRPTGRRRQAAWVDGKPTGDHEPRGRAHSRRRRIRPSHRGRRPAAGPAPLKMPHFGHGGDLLHPLPHLLGQHGHQRHAVGRPVRPPRRGGPAPVGGERLRPGLRQPDADAAAPWATSSAGRRLMLIGVVDLLRRLGAGRPGRLDRGPDRRPGGDGDRGGRLGARHPVDDPPPLPRPPATGPGPRDLGGGVGPGPGHGPGHRRRAGRHLWSGGPSSGST